MVRKSRKGREEWKIYKNVFDRFTERNIHELSSKGYFDELKIPLALGKEANVFIATRGEGYVIVKIYRLENCNFNKMFQYISADPRYDSLQNQKRKIVFSWTQREYRNLMTARDKVQVPTPIGFKDNIIIMEFIGNGKEAYPPLKDAVPLNPEDFFLKTIGQIKKLLEAGLVHGDLSEFNILNKEEEPVFIDMSQSTTIKAPNSRELFERDVKNIIKFFKKHTDVEGIEQELSSYFEKQANV